MGVNLLHGEQSRQSIVTYEYAFLVQNYFATPGYSKVGKSESNFFVSILVSFSICYEIMERMRLCELRL